MGLVCNYGWSCCLITLLVISFGTCALLESDVGQLSVLEIEDALQVNVDHWLCWPAIESFIWANVAQQCPLVQELNLHRKATAPEVPSYASQVFEVLFPGTPFAGLPGPAVNALLATLYISGPPS